MKINTYNYLMIYEQIIRTKKERLSIKMNISIYLFIFFFFILKLDILTKLNRKTNIACEVQWRNKS